MSTEEILIQAKGLCVTKGLKKILDIPSLKIKKGEFIAVTGPNGAGKSILLKTLAYLEPSFEGELFYREKQFLTNKEVLEVRRQMAMVFQDPLLLRGKVFNNVEIGLKIRGMAKTARKELVLKWLERFNIGHLANRDVRSLSGGEAQRVNLARAFVMVPDVIFLDEPFTYLDMPTKASLVRELKQILKETETTALMITHELMDIPYLADRMLVMMEGHIVQEGIVANVLLRPVSKRVAGFLGVENMWPLEQAKLVVATDLAVNQNHGTPWACIRPENILLYSELNSVGDIPNMLSGTIMDVQPYGYYYRIKLETASLQLTMMVSTVYFSNAPIEGETLIMQLPPDKIHIIWEK
ncbi:MAG: ABC transporter ATP-binding protein [Carboxydocellales bacterium]